MAEKYERQSRIFDTTLSAISDFVYILDCDGRFLYANKALLDLWGLTLEEAVGKNFFELQYPAELAAKLHAQIRWVVESRKGLSDETEYKSPAGIVGYYEYIFRPVVAADGRVEAVAGSTRDITQRKRRELNFTLLADMQKLLAPIATSGEVLRSVGRLIAERLQLTHCLFVEINAAADEATVIHDQHAAGEPNLVGVYRLADFHTDEECNEMAAGGTIFIDDVGELPRSSASAARFRQLGIGALANASYVAGKRWKFLLSVQKREPHRWTREDAELLPALAARLYLRLERAYAEEKLRESEERFRGTFENAALGIALVGLDGRWLRTNRALRDILGYSQEELANRTFADVTHPDDLDDDLAQVRRLLAGEISTYSLEKRYLRKGGAPVWANLTVSLLQDSMGRPLHFISTVEDINEKKAASEERRRIERELKEAKEEAETANRTKDRFLAVLSHELRTPLAPILMAAADLRADESLSQEVREELAMIERNVALEARLIDDLLDHTKIVNGKLTIRPQLCDAHSLIALVLEMVRGDAGQRQVAIHLDLAAGRSFLRGDPARLQQVFWNLLRNAVKFSRSGGAVSVRSYDSPRCTREDEDGSAICIEVMDQGVGFDPAVTEAIFRPFEQAASGHRFGGLGLGLAIARGIVEIHGGKIYGKSDGVGKGAAFTVELPAASRRVAEKAAPVTVEHPGKVESTGNMPPLRLLLVEDHEPTMHVITRLLTRGGHKIVAAGSVEEARAAAAREPFDLVISDLGLPDGTGVELMRHLRDAHGLRGIALSGYGTEEDLLQSGEAGFVEHLVKPIDFNDLRRALREFVAMRG